MTALALATLPPRVEARESVTLAMTHLSPFGLSEQWLLRDAGDRHWALIAQAMGQKQAVFTDANGRPVYAAFCATRLDLEPAAPTLGERIVITSTLYAVSSTRIGSCHLLCQGARVLARLTMISVFVSRDASGSNRRIVRNAPRTRIDLPPAPHALADLGDRARAVSRDLRGHRLRQPAVSRIAPIPALDFNAVGLLYFPTFSRLAETAGPTAGALRAREVVYLGNIDPGEAVCVHQAAGGLEMCRGDGATIAWVETDSAVPAQPGM